MADEDREESRALIIRQETEREIERSMRSFFSMRAEAERLTLELAEARDKIVQVLAENTILATRNYDLETKYENLLISHTTLKVKLSTIGGHGDTLSLTIAEVLSEAHEDPKEKKQLQTQTEYHEEPITPAEEESIASLAARLCAQTKPRS